FGKDSIDFIKESKYKRKTEKLSIEYLTIFTINVVKDTMKFCSMCKESAIACTVRKILYISEVYFDTESTITEFSDMSILSHSTIHALKQNARQKDPKKV
ncbi:9325_t:CDS:2, partial [Dentiscutata heterogama]